MLLHTLFFHHVPSPWACAPTIDVFASFSSQVVRAWREGQGHRSHLGKTIPDAVTNAR